MKLIRNLFLFSVVFLVECQNLISSEKEMQNNKTISSRKKKKKILRKPRKKNQHHIMLSSVNDVDFNQIIDKKKSKHPVDDSRNSGYGFPSFNNTESNKSDSVNRLLSPAFNKKINIYHLYHHSTNLSDFPASNLNNDDNIEIDPIKNEVELGLLPEEDFNKPKLNIKKKKKSKNIKKRKKKKVINLINEENKSEEIISVSSDKENTTIVIETDNKNNNEEKDNIIISAKNKKINEYGKKGKNKKFPCCIIL